jgi:hypothetical protein
METQTKGTILDRKPIGGWKILQDKTVEYRGYKIKNQEYGGVYFTKGDYDAEWTGDNWSDNATSADSVEHAIEMIDQEIAETQNTYVFVVGGKYIVAIGADSLEDAHAHPDVKTRGVLFSVNKLSIDNYKFPR